VWFEFVLAGGFKIAALGFGVVACAAADGAEGTGLVASGFFEDAAAFATPALATPAFVPDAEDFATTLFTLEPCPVLVLLTLAFGAGFFAAADFGSSFFSVNSNAGLGTVRSCGSALVGVRRIGVSRVVNAAGLTPAATAAFAAEAASAVCLDPACISGFTIT